MYYDDDLTLKEIAEVIQCSESHVSRVLKRAEFRLKEYVRVRCGE
jgi:DNA-directed RNA polymerase specialized sigma subunit